MGEKTTLALRNRADLQPARRAIGAVRSYTERAIALAKQLEKDPLDEAISSALVAHIVNGRATAEQIYRSLEASTPGIGAC